MGIENVTRKIEQEAEKEADKLLDEAEAEIRRINEGTKREVAEYQKKLKENAEALLSKERRKALAAAEFEGKRALLDQKKDVIDKVIADVKKMLQRMPTNERRAIMQKLAQKAGKEIAAKKVFVNAKDAALVKEALSGVSVVGQDILGGIIAESGDGKVRVDMSFETLLEQITHDHLGELSRVLFG